MEADTANAIGSHARAAYEAHMERVAGNVDVPWDNLTTEQKLTWMNTAAACVQAFAEDKAKRMDGLTFGEALERMDAGHAVQRVNWNGPGQYIALQRPNVISKMRRPYIYISPVGGQLVPWLASQSDMLENDWVDLGPLDVVESYKDGATAA